MRLADDIMQLTLPTLRQLETDPGDHIPERQWLSGRQNRELGGLANFVDQFNEYHVA